MQQSAIGWSSCAAADAADAMAAVLNGEVLFAIDNAPASRQQVLAGALANVEIGDEIHDELYRAVAEVLGFVLGLSRRVR